MRAITRRVDHGRRNHHQQALLVVPGCVGRPALLKRPANDQRLTIPDAGGNGQLPQPKTRDRESRRLGLTDAEIRQVDAFVRQNTIERFGPVRTVKPALVFELAFEGIQRSSRHKSGIAVRFPRMLRDLHPDVKVGALHDWVEIDGEFFSFEKGNNDAAKLEQALNERYLGESVHGRGNDVVVYTNAASSTGFDIQFAAKVGGVTERRRRPLNEEALELLQSPDKCGLLPKDLVLKLSRPHLIFKCKTPDGGERSLKEGPETTLTVVGDEGETTVVDLSRPVNYLRLSAVVLTAVFNHPAINQHSRLSPQPTAPSATPRLAQASPPPPAPQPASPAATASRCSARATSSPTPVTPTDGEQPVTFDPIASETTRVPSGCTSHRRATKSVCFRLDRTWSDPYLPNRLRSSKKLPNSTWKVPTALTLRPAIESYPEKVTVASARSMMS